MTRLLALFFILIFSASCDEHAQKGIIGQAEMVPLLTDMHLANGYTSMLYSTENKSKVAATYKAVYKKHGTDSAQVRKSLAFYSKHPRELQLIYAEVDSNINRLLREEQGMAMVRQKEAQQKGAQMEVERMLKEKWKSDSLNMLSGKYDFGLPSYFSAIEHYLTIYRSLPPFSTPVPTKTDSAIADSLKTR